jgi:hypothetical protein
VALSTLHRLVLFSVTTNYADMRFANTLPLIAAALVAGASSALANDSADPHSALYANQDNAGTVDHSAKNEAWAEIKHFVGGYNFFELLNYPGARAHRHIRAKTSTASESGAETPTPSDSAGSPDADLETSSSDPQLEPQERDFEDMEELEERKNHKKKKHGKKNKHKKKKHGKKSHKKKKHGKSHKKKHNKKKHNKKKHNKKHHKREEEDMDMVVRAYNVEVIEARMFDELLERYNVIGDASLNTREFIDIADFEARELGDLLWD